MPYYRTPSSHPIPHNKLILVKGETRKIVINGLAQSGQHYKLVANKSDAIDIIATPNNKKIEQSINLIAKKAEEVILTPEDPKHPNIAAPDLPKLTIDILVKLELPMIMTKEQLLLFKMLIAEAYSVNDKQYNVSLAVNSMQWMRYALLNRIELSKKFNLPTKTLGVPQNDRTLKGTICEGKVIEGFKPGGIISPKIETRIKQVLLSANTGSHKDCTDNRLLILTAMMVATGKFPGSDHEKKIYGWRTGGATPPSKNFVLIVPLQGQEFYTLSDDFLNSLKKK